MRIVLALKFLIRKTPEFTKMGEIHELFVLALSLVWLAGATLDRGGAHFSVPSWGGGQTSF